jgi:hypothetical protein
LSSNAVARPARVQEPQWVVYLTAAVALLIGLGLQFVATNQTQTGTGGDTSVAYPQSWVQTKEPGADFAAADLNNGGAYGARVSLRTIDKTTLVSGRVLNQNPAPSASDVLNAGATNWSLQRGTDLVGYRVLGLTKTTVQGHDAVNVESAYLMDSGLGAATNGLPGLMHAVDTVVLSGDKFYILGFAAESSQFDRLSSVHDKLLSGWHIP